MNDQGGSNDPNCWKLDRIGMVVIGIVVGTVAGWYMAITAIYSSNGKKDSE